MNDIIQIAENAYYVKSYSEATVLPFIPGITNQFTAIVERQGEDIDLGSIVLPVWSETIEKPSIPEN